MDSDLQVACTSDVHTSPELPWYAVMVRPGQEKLTSRALRNKGFEEFMPLCRVRRQWSDRVKEVEVALFPGYLFCRFDVNKRLPVLTAPGVFGIVSFGGVPHPLDDGDVSSVRALVASGKDLQPWPYLKTGARVQIGSGPLSGVEGNLVQIKNQLRLVVSVTLLQRSIAVEVDSDSVLPVR